MNVAMIVHNAVSHDARVIKEAETLSQHGHNVEIHGISPNGEKEQFTLPGSGLRVFLYDWKIPATAKTTAQLITTGRVVTLLMVAVTSAIAAFVTTVVSSIIPAINAWLPFFVLFFGFFATLVLLNLFPARAQRVWAQTHRTIANAVDDIANTVVRIVKSAYGLLRTAKSKPQEVRQSEEHIRNQRFKLIADALFEGVASRGAPDVVHVHDHVALMAAKHFKTVPRIRIVWDAHEIYEDLASSDLERAEANALIVADNEKFVDGFITINESIARFYAERYPKLPSAHVVMNASRPMELPEYDYRLHDAANLPRERKILLFQGGFGPKRGLQELVRAAAKLDTQWSIVLMGWGNLESELREIAAAQECEGGKDRVVFIPGVPQQELLEWTRGASLGAILYEDIGLNHRFCTPNKLWEYPVAGVPILCTNLVEMAKIIETYKVGFLLPREFDASDIANCVKEITDDALVTAQNNCGQFIAVNNWDTYSGKLLALYDNFAAQVERTSV